MSGSGAPCVGPVLHHGQLTKSAALQVSVEND